MQEFITLPDQLPVPGSKVERASLDFKAAPTPDSFENAKDVAAFANAAGGTILIGATARGELLAGYRPLSSEEGLKAQRLIEQAVRDRCRPGPLFEVVHIPRDAGVVIAVNIWPFPGQPVGVEIKSRDSSTNGRERTSEGLFFYPIRVGSHTKAITPDQLAMFMEPRLRRITICLQAAVNTDIFLYSKWTSRGNDSIWMEVWRLEDVDLLGNAITVAGEGPDGGKIRVAIPLDGIDAAYRSGDKWQVLLRGKISSVTWAGSSKNPMEGQWMIFDPNQ